VPKDPNKDDRLFAPFPIEMDEHPKIIGLTDAAFRAIFEATFYSRRMLSDGFLDERVVLRRWGADVASELSCNDPEKPSWIRVESPKPGWRIHDFEKHHPLRAEIDAKRAEVSAARSRAGSKGAAKRWQKDGKASASDSSETETETETSSSTKKREPATRGSRLHIDWRPSQETVDKIQAECPGVDYRREHATFVDYWIAQPGAKGVKLDWEATWRNWMRRKQGDTTRGGAPKVSKAAQNAAEYRRLFGDEPARGIPALDPGVSP
jgi:hypothetical protein